MTARVPDPNAPVVGSDRSRPRWSRRTSTYGDMTRLPSDDSENWVIIPPRDRPASSFSTQWDTPAASALRWRTLPYTRCTKAVFDSFP